MIRRSRVFWFTKIVKVLASAAAFLSWTGDVIVKKGADGAISNVKVSSPFQNQENYIQQNPSQLPTLKQVKLVNGESCPLETSKSVESSCDMFYVLVSTIDGRVSALDLHKHGEQKLAWSVQADSRPLYSSSLANMEMIRNGKKFRLIPSLDGALYQFDGEKVEAIPMSAESLLSSTYRLSDDSMIVGSKELQNFGLDLLSGEIQFSCSSEGCTSAYGEAKEGSVNGNNILVLTRSTHVIRSVDMKYGNEKWNFSVGQHQVSLPTKTKASQLVDDEEDNIDNADEKTGNYNIPFFSATKEDCTSEEMFPEDIDYENFLRLIVPEGRVVALSKADSSQVSWEHKFESPIAKAWLLRHGKLEPMSLFDSRHVPILNTYATDDIENESLPQPLLYIGSHQKLLYIQPSPHMESLLKSFTQHRIGHVFDPNIKVSWRPYLNTASVRTPIFGGNRPQFTGPNKSDKNTQKSTSTSLSVWHEDYPFDTGYFLYPEFRDTRSTRKGQIMLIEDVRQMSQEEDGKGLMETIPASLWYHWKEVAIISIVVSLCVHFVLIRLNKTDIASTETRGSESSSHGNNGGNAHLMVSSDILPSPTVQVSTSGEYISRFANDFDCLHCLGKGGFGVVFEAVNKVDAQHYAVKRTMLPRSEDAKEKVLREVRVLAKLEHVGIVRYFNAWVESPPVGWQEEKDKLLELSNVSGVNTFSDDPTVSIQNPKELVKQKLDASQHIEQSSPSTSLDNLLLPKNSFLKNSDSGEFSVHSNFSNDFETSESDVPHGTNTLFSFGFDSNLKTMELLGDSRSSIPFSNYTCNSSALSSYSQGLRDLDITGDSVVSEHNRNLPSDVSTVFENTSSLISDDSIVFENSSEAKHMAAVSKSETNISPEVGVPKTKPLLAVTLSSHSGLAMSADDEKNKHDEDSEPATALKPGCNYFLYIQMQLYRKDTLKDWLSNNTLNRDRHLILDIFDQIVCAVDYVHSCGLMHRDLKPSNIFFSADGVVKVGDFGLVTALSVQEADNPAIDSNASGRHTAEVGTTLYMSPEQIARKPYDLKIDIFSLGLIFLELWIPFSTQMERIKTLQDAKKQTLPYRFTKELPLESKIVFKMTSLNPELRPTTQEILDHPLFKDMAPTRAGTSKRMRTISDNNSY